MVSPPPPPPPTLLGAALMHIIRSIALCGRFYLAFHLVFDGAGFLLEIISFDEGSVERSKQISFVVVVVVVDRMPSNVENGIILSEIGKWLIITVHTMLHETN